MIKQFLNAMDDDREYDFIANNYSNMSKGELKSILLEYMYAIHSTPHKSMSFESDVKENVRDQLELKEIFG